MCEIVQIVETFPNWEYRRKSGNARYPWDEWFDGKIRIAELGVDFRTTIEAFVATMRCAAQSRLMSLEYRMTYTGVAFRAVDLAGK